MLSAAPDSMLSGVMCAHNLNKRRRAAEQPVMVDSGPEHPDADLSHGSAPSSATTPPSARQNAAAKEPKVAEQRSEQETHEMLAALQRTNLEAGMAPAALASMQQEQEQEQETPEWDRLIANLELPAIRSMENFKRSLMMAKQCTNLEAGMAPAALASMQQEQEQETLDWDQLMANLKLASIRSEENFKRSLMMAKQCTNLEAGMAPAALASMQQEQEQEQETLDWDQLMANLKLASIRSMENFKRSLMMAKQCTNLEAGMAPAALASMQQEQEQEQETLDWDQLMANLKLATIRSEENFKRSLMVALREPPGKPRTA
ncbi:hypothetical protein HYH02_013517 [Chlamydomonas schloesseri]|uniref:Uncharacterized protein n=1 Tax=Chlamydomonas schloesseri TaxID=2026947 RepID=A0A835T350_9CHLO|nr:hypothetical protein HYH02_013517 [Chlamydomonas schloesseri]|eukprot:KAG2430985.1 hypothetical protein HYH02_013517 [Chlamydomonas schloesseri]